MPNEFSRTELLLGKEAIENLKLSKVAVFGIGGVGSFAVEGLVRAGVGSFVLIDDDKVCLTNINRQIHATRKTVGKFKVDVMANRILEINPAANVEVIRRFYSSKDADLFFDGRNFDYIVDAIDTVTSKIDLVVQAKSRSIPIISCMGAGNKLDPTKFEIADIYETSICPLAKVMRHELRRRGIKSLKVVYSKETPVTPVRMELSGCKSQSDFSESETEKHNGRRQTPGSVSFVPSVAGLIIAGAVVKDLINGGSFSKSVQQ